jgi:hypothetical protein
MVSKYISKTIPHLFFHYTTYIRLAKFELYLKVMVKFILKVGKENF